MTNTSASQSGFRARRSTADAIWAHRWLAAYVQRYRHIIHILGIDLSRAFDTVNRDKLLSILTSLLDSDSVRIIRFLLADTTLTVRLGTAQSDPFPTTLGTPQGDALSPILFVIYLEAALRDFRGPGPCRSLPRPPTDALLPGEIGYADDIDLLSTDLSFLEHPEPTLVTSLHNFGLLMNTSKTEWTTLERTPANDVEQWRSLLRKS